MFLKWLQRVQSMCENSKLKTAVVKDGIIELHCGSLVEFCVGI